MDNTQEDKRQPTQKEIILTVTIFATIIALAVMVVLDATGVLIDTYGVECLIVAAGWTQTAILTGNKKSGYNKVVLVLAAYYLIRGLLLLF